MAKQKFTSSDPVEEILRIALQNTGGVGDADASLRQRLLASASELGISEEAVLQAQQQWTEKKKEQELLDEYQAHIRQELWTHAGIYVLLNFVLIVINALTSKYPWAIWPILGLGIGFGAHAVVTFFQLRNPKSAEFEAWKLRKEGKLPPEADRPGFIGVGIQVNSPNRPRRPDGKIR